MSLNIFIRKCDIPEGIQYVKVNDIFFDIETELKDDEFNKRVLSDIDKAEYVSNLTFLGRTKEFGSLFKNNLSTGTKTLLNIYNHPNKCFDVCECGNNALKLLPLIKEGNILWEMPAITYSGESKCNMVVNNKKYDNFYDVIEVLRSEINV